MGKIKNSKNGFTLIELLVTIVIILSVLGIGIVAFINLSNNKKEESYNLVKKEIIDAAKEYFYVNEYLFDGLEEGSSAIITVGKLVDEDYLNKVTDPRSGKTINYCSRVIVTKKDGKYKTEYEEFEEGLSCESNNTLLLVEPGAPSIDVKVKEGIEGNNNWYKSSVIVLALADTNGNGAISKTGICADTTCNDFKEYSDGDKYEDSYTYFNETSGITTWYMTENIFGKKAYKSITIKIDKQAPELTIDSYKSANLNDIQNKNSNVITNYDENWYSGYIGLMASATDNMSEVTITYNRTKGSIGGSGEKKNVTVSEKIYDYSVAQGISIYNFDACDEAGNCVSDSKTVKLDRESPTVSVTMENSSWTNASKVKYTYDASDNIGLLSLVGYWNKSELTQTKSDTTDCWWNGTSYGTGGCLGSNSENLISSSSQSFSGTDYFYAEGVRKIRFKACDQAGNCTVSNAAIARIDRTAPVFVETGSGYVWCKNRDETGYLAHGYSAKFKDNLSGATLTIDKYYSSWDCGGSKTGGFYWANSDFSLSSSENNEKIHTAFAGCTNNPSPKLRYALVDAAGNKYKDSNGNYYKELSHSSGSISSSNTKACDSSKWYNVSPNR